MAGIDEKSQIVADSSDDHRADQTSEDRRLGNDRDDLRPSSTSKIHHVLSTVFWTPPWCRWDPNKPPSFSLWHNVLFAFAGTFTVANLYYAQPILNVLAKDFGVDYLTISRIPTLSQGGYVTGLLFLCPMGDMLPRRPFTLTLVFITATLW